MQANEDKSGQKMLAEGTHMLPACQPFAIAYQLSL
jgi:hypothetical protein